MKITLLFIRLVVFCVILIICSCTSSVRFSSIGTGTSTHLPAEPSFEEPDFGNETFRCFASYYADKFNGRKTSSGEIFDNDKFTAAHRTLPFGTKVLVRNIETGQSVVVVINDRGPYVEGREIDLSKAAAKEVGFGDSGVIEVEITILSKP